MNVIDNYKEELLNLGDPIEIDDDTYFCKFNYNNMPFMIKTNKICVFKKVKKNKDNYVNISITSKDYLVWFESFYMWCVQTFHERSEDWFEEPLTLSDVEFSFINPLKSNIKDNCFDIQCSTDENRLHIVDTKDNVNSLDSLKDCNIIPTFHIKGVKFNNKHFSLDIEVNNILVILEDLDNDTDQMSEIPITPKQNEIIVPDVPIESHHEKCLEKDEDLNEVSLPMDDLEEMKMDIESNGFDEIYQLIDEKIKDNIIQNLQKLFNKKKIKLNMELTDIFDEEE
jgi:hypothetical protein